MAMLELTTMQPQPANAMEISNLCGTVSRKDGQVYLHLHVTVCGKDMIARGGHANELRVSATCEMVVRTISGDVDRRLDENIGLNLFKFFFSDYSLDSCNVSLCLSHQYGILKLSRYVLESEVEEILLHFRQFGNEFSV